MEIHISNNISHLIRVQKMTQTQLADRLGVSKGLVSHYTKGKTYPSFESLVELCRIFAVKMDDLVFQDMEKAQKHAKGVTAVEEASLNYVNGNQDVTRLLYRLERQLTALEDAVREHCPQLATKLNLI